MSALFTIVFTVVGLVFGSRSGYMIALCTPFDNFPTQSRYAFCSIFGTGFGGIIGARVGGTIAIAESIRVAKKE